MSQLFERTRIAVLLAAGICLAAPQSALAIDHPSSPVPAATEAAAGATETAQQAADTATGGPQTSSPQELAPASSAHATPATPDRGAPAAPEPAATLPKPVRETAEAGTRDADSVAGAATGAVDGGARSTSAIVDDAGAGSNAGSDDLKRDAAGAVDSLTAASTDVDPKLDSATGSAGQAGGGRDAVQQIVAAGTDDLPPGGGLLPTLLETESHLPLVGPADVGGIFPGGGGGHVGGGGSFAGGGGFPGSGGGPASGGGLRTGGGFPGGSSTPPPVTSASIAGDISPLFLASNYFSFPGALFAAIPVTRAASGGPAPAIPGRGPAPFAIPSLGAAIDGLLLAGGVLALLTIFFLMAPGLGRWIRTSAEKWPPPGLVSPIEVPG
jgi:hypothetical protein